MTKNRHGKEKWKKNLFCFGKMKQLELEKQYDSENGLLMMPQDKK